MYDDYIHYFRLYSYTKEFMTLSYLHCYFRYIQELYTLSYSLILLKRALANTLS